jgi:hypothetical protein
VVRPGLYCSSIDLVNLLPLIVGVIGGSALCGHIAVVSGIYILRFLYRSWHQLRFGV